MTLGPATVEGLNDAVRSRGDDRCLHRWGKDMRTDEGEVALRPVAGSGGLVDVVVFGRGTDRVTRYADEASAVRALAQEWLRPLPPPVERTPQEREADTIRMQKVARHALEQIEELKRAGRAQDD